jgi:hypothetical protein
MILRLLFFTVVFFTATSCIPRTASIPVAVEESKKHYPVEFLICNSSFTNPMAFVEIAIDNKQVFSGGLHVERQHNYFHFITMSDGLLSDVSVTSKTHLENRFNPAIPMIKHLQVEQDKPLMFRIHIWDTNIVIRQTSDFMIF